MPNSSQTAMFAPESLRVVEQVPATTALRSSSRDLGWNTILLDHFDNRSNREEHCEPPSTRDIRITVGLAGVWDLWSMQNGRWASAVFHPGLVNVREAGYASRLRWRNRNANRNFRVGTAFLPPIMLEDAADFYRRPGQRLEHLIPKSIVINDQVIASTLVAMVNAAEQGASDLYAEQGTRWLAAHLVHARGRSFEPEDDDRHIGRITDTRLTRVLDYIRVNLAKQMSITELANVAAVSPFHFCRLFSYAVGMSPHRYLVDRRMQKSEAMLRTTDIPLTEIAALSGYNCPNAFSVAFRRRYGMAPIHYRRTSRA